MPDQLLIADDEPALLAGLTALFRRQGYEVTGAACGEEALRLLLSRPFAAAVLDVMMPDMKGTEVVRRARESGNETPVIMLTALAGVSDKIAGLTNGADDYLTKPFSNEELVARVCALLRRSKLQVGAVQKIRTAGATIDLQEQIVERAGARSNLTPREVAILRYLFTHRGRAVSRQELLTEVWHYPRGDIETRTVENHIARVRQKLENDPTSPRIISTVRGEGYQFTGELESPV